MGIASGSTRTSGGAIDTASDPTESDESNAGSLREA
jgi:hypothetical protein